MDYEVSLKSSSTPLETNFMNWASTSEAVFASPHSVSPGASPETPIEFLVDAQSRDQKASQSVSYKESSPCVFFSFLFTSSLVIISFVLELK